MNNDGSDPIMNNDKSDHIMTNDEKRKALMDSEIDGFCIRYSLSDSAKSAIKKICEFGSKHSITQIEIYFDSPDSSE